jgi:hypothetical protein
MTYIALAYQREGYTGKLYLGEPACIEVVLECMGSLFKVGLLDWLGFSSPPYIEKKIYNFRRGLQR